MRFTDDIPDTKYSKYLLDTMAVRAIFSRDEPVTANYARVDRDLIWIPTVVYVEAVWGWTNRIRRQLSKDEILARDTYFLFQEYSLFMERHNFLPYTNEAIAHLPGAGRISVQDRRIAACAKAYGFKVVTRNTEHFSQLLEPHQIADWWLE